MSTVNPLRDFGTSLADDLSGRDDGELAALFRARPDLISPLPSDFVALATRATSGPSLFRAIEGLNLWQLQVLETCAIVENPFLSDEICSLTDKAARQTLNELVELALIYRDGDRLRIPRAVTEMLGENIAGLGPSVAKPIDLTELKDAPKSALEMLARLTWGPPRGHVEDMTKKGTAVEWLLKRHYLVPIDSKTVALPREIALHLRGGKVHKDLQIAQPEISGDQIKGADTDRAAVASISNLLRLVSELANFWAEETPSAIQSGGLGVRDLKKASAHLGIEDPFTAFLAEISYQIGIITVEADTRIIPTNSFDIFQLKSPENQWRDLVEGWLTSSRVAGLVGRSDSRNVNALGSELDRSNAARVRGQTLAVIAGSMGISPAISSICQAILWHLPHRRAISMTEDLVRWTIREAEWFGITGAGAISSFGHKLLSGEKKLGIDTALPDPVDHILIQSDNTAIAPGPLKIEISRQLSTFADIESRGSATVYRFTEASIRRGLDHGHTSDEIRAFLTEISKTPVPQPLDYLVQDVAKKHGRLRVGNTNSYIRCDDESTLKAILKDKRLDHLSIRQISPQVIISDAGADEVINELRETGYFPAAEGKTGSVITKVSIMRGRNRPKPARIIGEVMKPSAEIVKVAIKALRAGEVKVSRRTDIEIPRSSASQTLALINENLGRGVALRIGYADTNGAVSVRIIDPLHMSMGTLIARDHLTNGITPFKLARITGVTIE
jgi:hypothetical protein